MLITNKNIYYIKVSRQARIQDYQRKSGKREISSEARLGTSKLVIISGQLEDLFSRAPKNNFP